MQRRVGRALGDGLIEQALGLRRLAGQPERADEEEGGLGAGSAATSSRNGGTALSGSSSERYAIPRRLSASASSGESRSRASSAFTDSRSFPVSGAASSSSSAGSAARVI